MKKAMMICAMLIGMSSLAFAQGTGEIWGKVVDASTGISIPGVSVYVKAGNTVVGVSTDQDGKFKLKSLTPGIYVLEYSMLGYGKGTLEQVTVYADGYIQVEDYALKPGVDLTEAVIHADRVIGLVIPNKMNYADLEDMPDKRNLPNMISKISSDIQKTEDGELYFRGSRADNFVYYVDGVKVKAENFKIPSTAIGSIQVYTGGVPARYGDFTGGCVVIETQSYFDWLARQN